MSKTLPWRTLATPATPRERKAPSIALPWGSRIPDFRVTVTRAFIAVFWRFRSRRPDLASTTRRLNRADEHYTGHKPKVLFQGAGLPRSGKTLARSPDRSRKPTHHCIQSVAVHLPVRV